MFHERGFVFAIWLAGACAAAPAAAAPDVLAAWSQAIRPAAGAPIGGPPSISARFVLDGAGADCAAFELRPVGRTTDTATTPAARQNPNLQDFPITVCQALAPPDWVDAEIAPAGGGAAIGGFRLAGPASVGGRHADGIKVVSLGDTGCRGDADQPHCGLADDDWRFDDIAKAAATEQPDLVLHVGDYRYYGEGSTPDNWAFWRQDFFQAAGPLLATAPWLFARGNHEQCFEPKRPSEIWYGAGYFYLFGPDASGVPQVCPSSTSGEPLITAPWRMTIPAKQTSAGAIPAHTFISIDTGPEAATAQAIKTYRRNFRNAIALSKGLGSSWWVTHRPPISLAHYGGRWRFNDDDVRAEVAAALDHGGIASLCAGGRCAPSLMLAGHIHLYQYLDFGAGAAPVQAIVGNGGVVNVAGLAATPCDYDGMPPPWPPKATVTWDTHHGYVVWTRTVATAAKSSIGWTQKRVYVDGETPVDPTPTACAPTN